MPLSDYSLVSFDVDETISRKPVLYHAAHNLGLAEKWDRLDELYELKRISLRERLESHYKLLQGMRPNNILREVAEVEVMRNVRETVEKLRGSRLMVILLTDLPDLICAHLIDRFGFEGFVASKMGQRDGVLVGGIEPLDEKALGLRKYASWLNIPMSRCIHIGDGTNDIPVFRETRYSIALNSKIEKVRTSASESIEGDDMLDVYRHLSTLP